MNLAVLEAGKPPAELIGRFGTYPDMYRRMLGLERPLPSYDVEAGQFPRSAQDHDAYIVSGSPAGVYDDARWIGDLLGFLRAARGKARFVGICFGHQALAQAYGGRVEKSERGWGVGLHSYDVKVRQSWMDAPERVAAPASHQDQVTALPPGTEVTLASAFTPYAGLAWRDGDAISFQFHPEFEPAYAKALIETRRDRIDMADAAIATLGRPNDNARVAGWIRSFLGM
jgi:GMP synthase-like glutamine amidotransferase